MLIETFQGHKSNVCQQLILQKIYLTGTLFWVAWKVSLEIVWIKRHLLTLSVQSFQKCLCLFSGGPATLWQQSFTGVESELPSQI